MHDPYCIDLDHWELIIARSLLDLDNDQARTYADFELTNLERILLNSVNATTVRVACHTHDNITSLIYSII